jgi:hypothetical protein
LFLFFFYFLILRCHCVTYEPHIDGMGSSQNISNTTSEWAVDMSPAIDEASESKPATRGMKLAGTKKTSNTDTKPNSIPMKPVNERKSQEWADWKEDEEEW